MPADRLCIACGKQALYWVGSDGVNDYRHSCEEHVAELRQAGDAVQKLQLTNSEQQRCGRSQ